MDSTISANTQLSHPAYQQRVKLRGYNCAVTAASAFLPRDGARVLKRANPAWSQDEHLELAHLHRAESERLDALHGQLLDEAHQVTFGCAREVHDYRISAIGRDEYPETFKQRLRESAHGATRHSRLSWAHLAAGNRRKFNS